MALARPAESLPQQLEFSIPAHEACQPAGGGGVQTTAHGAGTGELEDLDRCSQALHGHRATRRHLHETLGQGQRIRRQQDASRLGHLLHTGGQVGGLPDRRVVHVEIGADRADHYLARVEPNADLDRNPATPEHVLGVALHGLLHA
jgi:hypothetical protein